MRLYCTTTSGENGPAKIRLRRIFPVANEDESAEDKSWSYDRALSSSSGKEIADGTAPRDSDRYHVNCMPSRLCSPRYPRRPSCTKDPYAATDAGFGAVERTRETKSREDAAGQWCSNCDGTTEFYDVINEASRRLNTIDNVTRLTDNPVLAYEYQGGEAARHDQ
ncbi:hypothetical protein ALC62_00603 [Cyphomyrmex costatus]|uniref:Uncharacterized protein n=1 Tax=Cyphomyrmex costatus TaxID=456900 RepID=A0A151IQK2_9HYME|nr:hypothetical protein ALC62_00603 [Cyphomyrmex costatus]